MIENEYLTKKLLNIMRIVLKANFVDDLVTEKFKT